MSSNLANSIKASGVIAFSTFIEAIRNRLLYIALFFVILLIGLSVAAASVSIWERGRLIIDVGLAAAIGIGSIIANIITPTIAYTIINKIG